jgi:hypothetical protein
LSSFDFAFSASAFSPYNRSSFRVRVRARARDRARDRDRVRD